MKNNILFTAFFLIFFLNGAQAQWTETGQLFVNSNSSARIGIGTNSPDAKLDVFQGNIQVTPDPDDNIALSFIPQTGSRVDFRSYIGSSNGLVFDVDLFPLSNSDNAVFRFFRQTNTSGSKRVDFMRGDGSGDAGARINVDGGNSFFNRYGGNVGIGVFNPQAALHVKGDLRLQNADNNNAVMLFVDGNYLWVDGRIRCREVRVTNTGWSDFVFEDDYRLRPLSEVEQFIQTNKHLPDVPPAKEVLEKGTDLGKIDAILLQKIEELTLYLIDLKKENEALKTKVERLENDVNK